MSDMRRCAGLASGLTLELGNRFHVLVQDGEAESVGVEAAVLVRDEQAARAPYLHRTLFVSFLRCNGSDHLEGIKGPHMEHGHLSQLRIT